MPNIKTITKACCITLLACCLQAWSWSDHPADPPPVAKANANIWDLLEQQFHNHQYPKNPQIDTYIRWYQRHPEYLRQIAVNARPYLYYIYQEIQKRQLPSELILLPLIESEYKPTAYSWVGAAGLWQIMPGTGKGFGLEQNWWYDGRLDVVTSTQAALDYLEYLEQYFNGTWPLAIAAYDSGQGTVRHALQRNKRRGKSTDFWSLPLPKETKAYLPKYLALATILSDPKKYHIRLPAIPNKPYFEEVKVGSQIDLTQAARLAKLSLKEIHRLNPGYKRWATDPNGHQNLLIPVNKSEAFKRALTRLPAENRLVWHQHKVSSGESLSIIADSYHTSTAALKAVNRLASNLIHPGQALLIPPKDVDVKAWEKRQLAFEDSYREFDSGIKRLMYTVKPNDSLWSISHQFKISQNKLKTWNHKAFRHTIHPGDKLTIWLKDSEIRKHTRLTYQVKPGDSLSRIAVKHKVPLKQVLTLNNLEHDSVIRPGQKLVLRA